MFFPLVEKLTFALRRARVEHGPHDIQQRSPAQQIVELGQRHRTEGQSPQPARHLQVAPEDAQIGIQDDDTIGARLQGGLDQFVQRKHA